jgi:hypothetical protein
VLGPHAVADSGTASWLSSADKGIHATEPGVTSLSEFRKHLDSGDFYYHGDAAKAGALHGEALRKHFGYRGHGLQDVMHERRVASF